MVPGLFPFVPSYAQAPAANSDDAVRRHDDRRRALLSANILPFYQGRLGRIYRKIKMFRIALITDMKELSDSIEEEVLPNPEM